MSNIATQLFEGNEIRIIQKDGEPWFVAKDILVILLDNKEPNVGEATKDLEADEKNSIILNDGNKGNPNITIISESGLYSLIMRSRKPIAKPFQKWVTREVLPSIRKTGSYSISQQIPETVHQDFDFDNELKSLEKYEAYSNKMINFLENLRKRNKIDLYRFNNIAKHKNITLLEFFGIDFENEYFIPTELGTMTNRSPIETNKILEARGFQTRENGVWHLTEKGHDFGIEVSNGSYLQLKWKLEVVI